MKTIFLTTNGIFEKFQYSELERLKERFETRSITIGNFAIIGDYAKIGEGAKIGDRARIGDGARVGDGVILLKTICTL